MHKHAFILIFVLFFSHACQEQKSGIDMTRMDQSVRPQDNFYNHMNGTWLKEFKIPADKSGYGTFTKLSDNAEKDLKVIIDEAAQSSEKEPGSNTQKVGDMFLSFMDSTAIEELGIIPIQEEIEMIRKLQSKKDVVDHMARLDRQGISTAIGAGVWIDAKKSDQYIVVLLQGGLSLPNRSYYLDEGDRFKEFRTKFVSHMEKIFTLTGMENSSSRAKKIMAMETEIAKNHWTRVESRNRDKTYNKYALADFDDEMDSFNFAAYAGVSGYGQVDSVWVYQPSFFKALGKIYKKYSLDDWKTYLMWNLITHRAPYLSKEIVEEDFDFFRRVLRGTEQNRPRWKRAVSATTRVLGEVIGQLYVEKHFKPEAKERMVTLVENLRIAFAQRINGLDWMSSETKSKALAKLEKFNAKIGYPDKWKDYSALQIKADDLVGNIKRSAIVEHERAIDKLGKPIDKDEWGMTPQRVNAYYSPTRNEIVFPAAILQPPFFNMEAEDAANYGGIGAVIGHEFTHGFDDQGRKSDGDGNLKNWWTEEDGNKFEERSKIMVDQYNNFNPIDTFHVNGKQTLGENIADLGGLTIAYYAYKNSLDGKDSPVIDGLTGEQRVFLSWAQIWSSKYKDETLIQRLKAGVHSPGEYRTNGIVVNMPEFYEEFNVTEQDSMYVAAENRVKIW